MTKRTTDEWQSLLDGVAEGPWEARQDGHDPVWMIGRLGDNPARIVGDGYGEGNARLIAAAPEAVAEVVRLREELEALRRACIESAEEAERNAEVAYIPDPYVAVEEAERDTADIITRILEGSES